MVRRICEITVTVDFIFRRVLCSHEDVSFNILCLNVLEGIMQFILSKWFKKNQLETPFKGDDVKSINKNVKLGKIGPLFLRENQKIAAFAMLIWFSLTNNRLKTFLAYPNDQKYPRYPLVLKFNVSLARPLSSVIPFF